MKYAFLSTFLLVIVGAATAASSNQPIPEILPLERIEVSLCEEPFTSGVYQDGRDAFRQMLASMRSATEMPEAVRLQKLIIEGFEQEKAEAICEGHTRKRMINAGVGRLGLTAAHVAAMMQDLDALRWLVEQGARVNAVDKRGFSPAHFAALGETRDCLDFLSQGVVGTKNEFGATPEQVWQLTHLKPSRRQSVYFSDFFTEKAVNLDGNHFCMFTGEYFAEGIKQTPKSVLQTWAEEFQAREIPEVKVLTQKLEEFRPFSARLYLQNTRQPNFKEILGPKDFELHANQDFSAGDVIEVYAGLWQPEKNAVVHNLFALRTDEIIGYLPFASERGPPNMAFVQFFNRLGVSQGHFGMAIRPIKRGERIVRERLAMETVVGSHPEADPDVLDNLVKETPITELSKSNIPSFELEHIRNRAVIKYLGDNPLTLIRLCAEEKITPQDFRDFAASTTLRLQRIGGGIATNILFDVITAVERLFKHQHIRRFIASKARKGKMLGILRFFEMQELLLATKDRAELEFFWDQWVKLKVLSE